MCVCVCFAANNSSVIRGQNVTLGTPVHLQRLLGVLRFFSFWWSHQTREKPIRAGGGGGNHRWVEESRRRGAGEEKDQWGEGGSGRIRPRRRDGKLVGAGEQASRKYFPASNWGRDAARGQPRPHWFFGQSQHLLELSHFLSSAAAKRASP